ncbi:hypothetical protein ACX80N_12385 [Arthrobacter sp. MDT2-16]
MDSASDYLAELENEMVGANLRAHIAHDETVGDVLDLLHLIACLSGRPVAMKGAIDPRLRLVHPHSLNEECSAREALLNYKVDRVFIDSAVEESSADDAI